MNPVTPDNVAAIDVLDNRVTIQWTVPSIAYTPETYAVEYGTSQDSLGLTSGSQHSGPDITVTDVTYSVRLSNLEPATTYHYHQHSRQVHCKWCAEIHDDSQT